VVALLTLLLGATGWGCSDAPAEQRAAAAEPRQGGVLRMLQEAPRSLDPLSSDSVYESIPLNQIFDTLVTFDASLNVVPSLAETWTITADGKVYTFDLRRDVRFHDGTELRSDDVVYSVRRLLRRGTGSLAFPYTTVIEGAEDFSAGRREALPGVRALDDFTVQIRLERATPSFLEVLTLDGLGVVPGDRVEELGDERFAREPLGTGPFRLARWSDDHLLLEANHEYFAGPPHLEGIEIRFLRDDETDYGTERFFRGELDLLEPPTHSLEQLAAEPGVEIYRYQELSLSFLGLNTQSPPLDQPWLRRAIAHAIDGRALVAQSVSVRREAMGILPPGISGYSPEPKALAHDPRQARELLARHGHAGGAGLPPIKLYNPSGGVTALRVLDQLRADLGAVGIELEVEQVTWAEVSRRLEDGTIQAFLLAWIADLTDPDAFLRAMFAPDSSNNLFGYRSAEAGALLERAAAELNPVSRMRIYRELERHILSEAPLVPLYHTVGVLVRRDDVNGLQPGPLGLSRVAFEKVWLDRDEGRT
jgi:ABC-type transport system substrate-binding protein